ncbi:thioesterase family protein [Vagococcus lutrae]|uniref:thioesterase family protein n=1 Tax=Vagococcus lutrae TaxID=81947 RepID=UPI00200DA074|nr:diaminopimelate epimerase [Vagococcus lutrae]UQF12040.1 diaminopimelate epimerase [Vagococcus lutrae]
MSVFNYQAEAQHAASAMGSGELEVVATPALIAFAENACHQLVELAAGETSVGTFIELNHLRASRIPEEIKIDVKDVTREGNRFSFIFEIRDSSQLIATGKHQRAVVDVDRFLSSIK